MSQETLKRCEQKTLIHENKDFSHWLSSMKIEVYQLRFETILVERFYMAYSPYIRSLLTKTTEQQNQARGIIFSLGLTSR